MSTDRSGSNQSSDFWRLILKWSENFMPPMVAADQAVLEPQKPHHELLSADHRDIRLAYGCAQTSLDQVAP